MFRASRIRLTRIRTRGTSERGFTLIELLVVILIIGILAAIAIPSFIGHRDKANDVHAKSNARTLAVLMENCRLADPSNTYDTCGFEQPLRDANGGSLEGLDYKVGAEQVDADPLNENECGIGGDRSGEGYEVVAWSKAGGKFCITRYANGSTVRGCTIPGRGLCPANGRW